MSDADFGGQLSTRFSRMLQGSEQATDVIAWLERQRRFNELTKGRANFVLAHPSNQDYQLSLTDIQHLLTKHIQIWFVEQPVAWERHEEFERSFEIAVDDAAMRCVIGNEVIGGNVPEFYLGISVPAESEACYQVTFENGRKMNLSPNEFRILRRLWVARGELILAETLRDELFSHLPTEDQRRKNLKVHMLRLRERLAAHPLIIETVGRMSFRLVAEGG